MVNAQVSCTHLRRSPDYLDWHMRERIPDAKVRETFVVLETLSDEHGQLCLHVATLARACGISRSTLQRRTRKLSDLGRLTIIERRVKRDYNAANVYIVNTDEGSRGGAGQNCDGKALSTNTETIEPPAAPKAKPRTRHIVASSRIAEQFCRERGLTCGWFRRRLTLRIEELLNGGGEEAAIVAQLDREHRERSAARHHWRKKRPDMREASVGSSPAWTAEEIAAIDKYFADKAKPPAHV